MSRVNFSVIDTAAANLQPVKQDALFDEHSLCFLAPSGFRVAGFAKVRAKIHRPVWVNAGGSAGKKLGCLHDFGRHDPLRLPRFLGDLRAIRSGLCGLQASLFASLHSSKQVRARKKRHQPTARRLVSITLLDLGNLT